MKRICLLILISIIVGNISGCQKIRIFIHNITKKEINLIPDKDYNYRWGFRKKSGKFIIKPQFDYADSFIQSEGIAPVKLHDKWGFIDKTGKIVIDIQFDYINVFLEGLCAVRKDDKWGFIDKTGIVVEPQFEWVSDFENGKAHVRYNGEKSRTIDKTGKFIE